MLNKPSIEFKVPFIPPSANKIYWINYNERRVYLSEEARNFKTAVKSFMPLWEVDPSVYLRFDISIYDNWYTKEGSVRKRDIQNLDKIIIDACCERLGIGDERVWERTIRKLSDDKLKDGFTVVKIEIMEVNNVSR